MLYEDWIDHAQSLRKKQAAVILRRATILSPISVIASGGGPIQAQ